MQIVRFKTELPEEELIKLSKEREPDYRAMPGLLQKYYIKPDGKGEYGGVYIWDSMDSMKNFRESELAKTIPRIYQATEPPTVEIVEILFPLRD